VSDWLKPASVPRESPSDDEPVLDEEMNPPAAPGVERTGQGTGASGGYGTASGRASSGGSGEGTENTSNAGDDDQTDWLREAPGGGEQR
jgi:hypothetical protein